MDYLPSVIAQANAGGVSAVSDAAGELGATAVAALPIIALVAVAWVAIGFVKRLVKKAG